MAFLNDVYLIPLGTTGMGIALALSQKLKAAHFAVEIAFGNRALKTAMKYADKSGARYVVILGDTEIASGRVDLKQMHTGETVSVTLSALAATLSAERLTW